MAAVILVGIQSDGTPVWVSVDGSGHLQVDVLTNALPTGAATLAEQQTQTTALQLIDDLRNALADVATDELRVLDPRERSPVKVTRGYGGVSVPPHGTATRWTYTVPANRKAILESGISSMLRDAAATAAGRARAIIQYTPSGGSTTRILSTTLLNTALYSQIGETWSGSLLMLAGDVLDCVTLDAATGGSIIYDIFAVISEFDA